MERCGRVFGYKRSNTIAMTNKTEKKADQVNPEKEHQKDVETVVSKNDNVKPIPTEEELKEKKKEK